jgi:uncharacterized membrane protein YciS (DUF1049 family)
MKIVYRITEKDFIEAQRAYRSRSHSGNAILSKIMIVAGLVVLIAGVSSFLFRSSQLRGDLFPGIPAGFVLLALFWLAPRLATKKAFKSDKRLQNEISAEILESAMDIRTGNSSARIAWTDCAGWMESENLFLVFQSSRAFNIFPKRSFVGDEVDEFRQLLARKFPVS